MKKTSKLESPFPHHTVTSSKARSYSSPYYLLPTTYLLTLALVGTEPSKTSLFMFPASPTKSSPLLSGSVFAKVVPS